MDVWKSVWNIFLTAIRLLYFLSRCAGLAHWWLQHVAGLWSVPWCLMLLVWSLTENTVVWCDSAAVVRPQPGWPRPAPAWVVEVDQQDNHEDHSNQHNYNQLTQHNYQLTCGFFDNSTTLLTSFPHGFQSLFALNLWCCQWKIYMVLFFSKPGF